MNRHRFTLAELLAALAVTAVVVPIAIGALSLISRADRTAEFRRQAALLADTRLQELIVTDGWRDAEDSGDFGEDYPGFTWSLATDEWSEGEVALRQLDLTVYGPGRIGREGVTLTALVSEGEEE